MEIVTRDYGVIEINEELIIRFDDGILGFEPYKNYILLDDSNGESPFRCLQSMEESDLAFILMDPFAVDPDYEITLGEDIVETLMIESSDDVLVLAVVVVPEDIKKTSINLKAPLVFNVKLRKGAQYIVDGDKYKIRHNVMDEIEKMKNNEKAGLDAAGSCDPKATEACGAKDLVGAGECAKDTAGARANGTVNKTANGAANICTNGAVGNQNASGAVGVTEARNAAGA